MKIKILMILGVMALLLSMPISLADRTEGSGSTSIIKLDPKGDDEYQLIFENMQGLVYNVPYITNEGGIFKYGNDDRDLVFIEPTINFNANSAAEQHPNVGHRDYFVVTDYEDTYVFRYDNYNSLTKEIKFKDMATGDSITATFQDYKGVPGIKSVGTLSYMDYGCGFFIADTPATANPP